MSKQRSKRWGFIFAGIIGFSLITLFVWTTFIGGDNGHNEQVEGGQAKSLINEEESKKVSVEDIETVEPDVKYESISDVIAGFHSFYNDTLGYGKINSIAWDKQKKNANAFIEYVNRFENTFEGTLQIDIENAEKYAKKIIDGEKDPSDLTAIHRILHDLDIAVNDYKNYKKVWGVTETLNR